MQSLYDASHIAGIGRGIVVVVLEVYVGIQTATLQIVALAACIVVYTHSHDVSLLGVHLAVCPSALGVVGYPSLGGLPSAAEVLALGATGTAQELAPRVFVHVVMTQLAILVATLHLAATQAVAYEAPCTEDGAEAGRVVDGLQRIFFRRNVGHRIAHGLCRCSYRDAEQERCNYILHDYVF